MNRTDLMNRGMLLLGLVTIVKLLLVVTSANPFTPSYVAEAAMTDIVVILMLCAIFYKQTKRG